jgi:hypothetical protein
MTTLMIKEYIYIFWGGITAPQWDRASSFTRFLEHTQRRTTVGRTTLDEWSARRRDLYLTTHKTHKRLTSTPPVGFEPTVSAGQRPKTYALDRAATGNGIEEHSSNKMYLNPFSTYCILYVIHIHLFFYFSVHTCDLHSTHNNKSLLNPKLGNLSENMSTPKNYKFLLLCIYRIKFAFCQ